MISTESILGILIWCQVQMSYLNQQMITFPHGSVKRSLLCELVTGISKILLIDKYILKLVLNIHYL